MRRNKRIAVAIVGAGVGIAAAFDIFVDGPVIDGLVDLIVEILDGAE